MQDGIGPDHRPGDPPRNGVVAWLGSSGISSSARSIRPIRTSSRARPPSICRTAPRSGRSCDTSSLAMVHTIRRCSFTRYSWPVEFVVRAIKEVGWQGFSVDKARSPLANMGQAALRAAERRRMAARVRRGSRRATMLARTNFAATLAPVRKDSSPRIVQRRWRHAQALLAQCSIASRPRRSTQAPQQALCRIWRRRRLDRQRRRNSTREPPGLARLLVGSSEYQLV